MTKQTTIFVWICPLSNYFNVRIACALILIGSAVTHCTQSNEGDSDVTIVDPVKITDLSNVPTLSQYTLTCTESELIATDHKANRIHIFDYETLEIIQTFGREGRGPGELNSAYYALTDNNNIYISDTGNQRIHIFKKDDWSHLSTISSGLTGSRFVSTSNHLFLSSPFGSKENPPLKRINKENSSIKHFGEWLNYLHPGRNMYHLLSHEGKGKIIAVSHTEPLIQFYNRKGELLSRHNLESDQHLAKTLRFINQFYQDSDNRNRTVTLFKDASIIDNYLVLNLYTRSPADRLKSNNYLIYEIDKNKIRKVDFFETNVGGGYTSTFCVHEHKLFSNGGADGIDIYTFDLSFLD